MNGRKAKALRRKAKEILVEWLHSVLPEEEDKAQINVNNIEEYLTDQKYIYANRKLILSAFTFRWMYKRLKKDPGLTFEKLKKEMLI